MATKTPLGQMIIELGLDSTDFGKGLTSAKREVRTWSSEMSASMRAADSAGDKIGKLQARYGGLTKIISAQQKQVDSLKQSYDNSFVDGKATAQTEKLASQLKKAEANLITYQSELRETAGELAKVKIQTEGLTGVLRTNGERLQKFGKGATTVGNTLTKGLTIPLMAAVTLATKAASDWESDWAGVVKTNDDVVDANGKVVYSLSQLEDELRSLAKELPATHSEIAGVAEAAGQLGIETDNITSFTKTMIDMGESTNLAAETAAESLARFANITGMSQTDFDKLGSSIVELGNNFATTEADIVALSMRLAGAGSQVGMSEADIMGLAAALSSVGIEAEMGGSALSKTLINMSVASETGLNAMKDLERATGMSRRELELLANHDGDSFKGIAISLGKTTTELNKILKAGKDLEGFAAIAGMTGEEFKQAFEKDAVGALGSFIEGLGAAEEQGTSAIALLDDLGISEVRLRDALLRAGNASELFATSVKMSNDAWEENTALTEEAEVRYETLESQLGMLRNEAVDVAIEFGGPFVKALREALEAAKPFVGVVSDLAESFADADPKTQQMILKMIGFGIAVGPVTKGVGTLSTGLGNASVKTVDFLAEMAKKKTMTDFGGAAVTASGAKGIGAMIPTLGTLSPLLIGLVGAGGLLAVGYGAWKSWGEEAYNAGQRTKRWGTDVGEATEDVLTDIQETQGVFNLLQQGVGVDSDLMIGNFQKMGQSIDEDINRRLQLTEEYLGGLPDKLRNSVEEMLGDYQENLQETQGIIQKNNDEIAQIQQKASDENRNLNAYEWAYINELQRYSMDEYIGILDITATEEKAIRSALSGDVENISKEQTLNLIALLNDERTAINGQHQGTLRETEAYLKERNLLNTKAGDEILGKVDSYYESMRVNGDRTMQELLSIYPKLAETHDLATGNMLSTVDHVRRAQLSSNKLLVESWAESHRDMGKESREFADAQSMLVDVTRVGAETWNKIVVESGGNVEKFREGILEVSKTAEGWNHIRFQIHEANLDSNARLIIAEAAIQHGYWDGMVWEDKQALLKDSFSETVYKAIERSGLWNELTIDERQAVLSNEFSDTVALSLIDTGKWNNLTIAEQKAVLTTNTPETLAQTLKDIGLWEALDPKIKDLLINNGPAKTSIEEAERKLDEYGNIVVKRPIVNVQDNVTSEVTKMQQTINQLTGKKVYIDAIARAGGSASSRSFIESGGSFLEKGTNYHPGGPAIVNDQKGSMYRELIQNPDGTSYIPYGRNVLIPNLARGAKVLRASLTKQRFPDLPQYRDGIGNIPVESTVIQNIRNTRSRIDNTSTKNIQVENLLREVVRRLDDIRSKKDVTEINQTNHIHGVKPTEKELSRQNKIVLEQLAYKYGLT